MEYQNLPVHNPAERLLAILQKCSQEQNQEPIRVVLSRAMEVDDDLDSFYQGFFELQQTINNIEQQIKFFPTNKSKAYQGLLNDIKQALLKVVINPDGIWTNNSGRLGDPTWHTLQFLPVCVEDFKEYKACLSEEELDRLRATLFSLIKYTEESAIEENLKKFILVKLNEILLTVNKFYIHGYQGIKKEIFATLVELGMTEGDDSFNTALLVSARHARVASPLI